MRAFAMKASPWAMLLALACAGPATHPESTAPSAEMRALVEQARCEAPVLRERYGAWEDVRFWEEFEKSGTPGLFARRSLDQGDFRGEVVHVDSDIAVLRLTEDSSMPLPPFVLFGVFGPDMYLGEALVVCARGRLVACELIALVDGAAVKVGDQAWTNL